MKDATKIHRYSVFYQPAENSALPTFRRRMLREQLSDQRMNLVQS